MAAPNMPFETDLRTRASLVARPPSKPVGERTMDNDAVLEIIFGRWRSQIAYSGVKLGVFHALRREDRARES
jgi:hypothetical protein